MGLKICSLGSGSAGNCIYIASNTTKVLIDIGIPVSRVAKSLAALRENCSDINVLVTHAHSDHIAYVPAFAEKFSSKVYAHYRTTDELKGKMKNSELITEFGEDDFYVGDLTISPFHVSHDVPCVGYSIYWRGKKVSVATDLGIIGNGVLMKLYNSDLVLLEANHDENLLRVNKTYSPWLKKRILSERGHLSNSACAEAALKLCRCGAKQIILGHLSRENNYPELAYSTVAAYLKDNGVCEGEDVMLEVARQDRLSSLFEVC